MKRTLIVLAALGLSRAGLHATDPTPTHGLTLDATGKPTADLNLASPHVTGTLDAARLPAGIGGAFLAGVTRPTGTDATALDHVDVSGIALGDVRQMVFTSGLEGFEGGVDDDTFAPLAYAAATYRLVAAPAIDSEAGTPPAPPDTVPTPTDGEVWRLVSAALSNGDVCGPNGSVQSLPATLNQGHRGGSIDLSHNGGNINLSQFGGGINLSGYGGSIDLTAGGSIRTYGPAGYIAVGGAIDTMNGGAITTNGGAITVAGSISTDPQAPITTIGTGSISTNDLGYIATGPSGYISTGIGGFIDTTGGGSITAAGNIVTTSTGYISTGGFINTTNGGYISTFEGAGIDTSNGTGGIATNNSGGYIFTCNFGGNIDTSGGGGLLQTNGHGSPEGVVTAPVGSLYTDQDGGPGAVLYVKEPGSDDHHGWAAK